MQQDNFQCRNCASKKYAIIYKGIPDRFYGFNGAFTYVKCQTCGLFQLLNTPKKISDYYSNYRLHASDNFLYHFFRKIFLKTGYFIPKEKKGRVLDVGCGNGWYLMELKKRGWECWGYEINKEYAAELADKMEINVLSGHDLSKQINCFDLVTLNFSFEHLNEPKSVLAQLFRSLKKGGRIIVSIPNIESQEARLFKSRWFHLDPPRHITFYTKDLLSQTLASLGFSDIIIKDIAIPTGFAGSLSYLVFSKFIPLVWYISVLPGFIFSRMFRDGNFMVMAAKNE